MNAVYFYEDMRCPVCGELFRPEDDVVVCPVCGLPHHRSCWKAEGHCHLADRHGTPAQWKREDMAEADRQKTGVENDDEAAGHIQVCPRCQAENPEFAEFCCRCGCPLGEADWQSDTARGQASQTPPPYCEYKPFRSPYGAAQSYDPHETIGDSNAADLAAMVGSRTDYYMPRFRRIADGRSGGWNWAAFLFGPYWLLYRKMYLSGSLVLLLQLLQSCVFTFIIDRLSLSTPEKLYRFFSGQTSNRQEFYLFLSITMLTMLVYLVRFSLGALGNGLYHQHAVWLIRKKRQAIPDMTAAELSTAGGTSFGILIIGYIAVNVASMLCQLIL